MSWQQTLICKTEGTRDDRARHFRLSMDRALAEWLLTLRRAMEAARTYLGSGNRLFCIEVFAPHGNWGTVPGYEPDPEHDWVCANPDTVIVSKGDVELRTVKATPNGVQFSAAWRNDDAGIYFETPELPWDKVVAYCGHRGHEQPHGICPGADVDYETNNSRRDEDQED